MINTNDFKTGQTIKVNNKIYQILEFLHVKPGKGSAFVRSKLKNMKTGEIIEHIFNAGIKIEKAFINKVKLKFSYINGESYFFLNMSNYEQFEVLKKDIKHILKYLTEETFVELILDENQNILDIIIPEKISLKVIKTDNFKIKNNSKKNTSFKDAVLETGLIIKVPFFIKEGENIIINTNTGLYFSRNIK
jgi:elongation factor P